MQTNSQVNWWHQLPNWLWIDGANLQVNSFGFRAIDWNELYCVWQTADITELLEQLKRRRYKSDVRVGRALFMRYDKSHHDKLDGGWIKIYWPPADPTHLLESAGIYAIRSTPSAASCAARPIGKSATEFPSDPAEPRRVPPSPAEPRRAPAEPRPTPGQQRQSTTTQSV